MKITPEYQKLLDYWAKGGEKNHLMIFLKSINENCRQLQITKCRSKKDVIDAMFRQINNNTTKTIQKHQLPGKIYAYEYDLGK